MKSKPLPNMTYRFTWDEEPSEEQLQALMRGVAEKVRHKNAEIARRMRERIASEYERITSSSSKQQ